MNAVSNMEKILKEIKELRGLEGLSNGRVLVSLFSDLSTEKKDLRLVRYLVESGCHTDLLGARELTPAMQQARLQQTVKKLCAETLISEEASRQVCTTFWSVLYGSVPVQKMNNEQRSEEIQKPTNPMNAQKLPGTQPITPDKIPLTPPERESVSKDEKPKIKLGLMAAVLAVVLIAAFLPGLLRKEASSDFMVQEQKKQASLETVGQRTGVPRELREDPMEEIRDEDGLLLTSPVFGTGIMRDQVGTVTFLSTLEDAPEDVYDLSAAGDGSVLGWAILNGELYDLYIAADGGVKAPSNCQRMFAHYINVWSISFNDSFDTSNTTNMSGMFERCLTISSIDTDCIRTSKVTDMSGMFKSCGLLTRLDVSGFDTSQVTNMDEMFYGCTWLRELDLSNFDTARVTSMNSMFAACGLLTQLDLSSFDTSCVTSMDGMFTYCSDLISLDVSSFNTEKVCDMGMMFAGCGKLKELNLHNFYTPSLTDTAYMFEECEALVKLDLSNFDTSSVVRMSYMFSGCNKLKRVTIPNFDVSSAISYRHFMNDGAKINGRPWETYFPS